MISFGGLLLWTVCAAAAPWEQLAPAQHVLNPALSISQGGNPRKLQGRFLHITDVHPDPFYKPGTDPTGEHPCHKGDGNAGSFGAETTDCDTPFVLVNATFKWIKENIKDSIDFVIWTGDSARHDNDEQYPRSNRQVEELNRFVVQKFVETFGKPDNKDDPDPTNDFVVPIVPTYGNNDILPHNIFEPGPNRWTSKYSDIWAPFVPQEQRHSFARGGWFFSEVIPNKLAVFSLNTLYFFDSNSAVDGCDAESEPGYEHFEWLRIQLEFLRDRKMKAILIGHVPPARTESKQNWDETCYQKWTLWQRQYRDVIVGNIFGHMNIDHFMFQDEKDLSYKFKIDGVDASQREQLDFSDADSDIHAAAKADYLNDLRDRWAALPKPPKGFSYQDAQLNDLVKSKKKKKKGKKQIDKFLKEIGGPWGERYSLTLVSPSIVPNFFPTIRIIEYNMTGLEKDHPAVGLPTGKVAEIKEFFGPPTSDEMISRDLEDDDRDDVGVREDGILEVLKKKKARHKKKKGKKPKPNFPVPKPPSKTSIPGPAYSPQTFTFLNWTQYYANLTTINAASAKDFSVSELDYRQKDALLAESAKKHFKFEVEYNTKNDTVYHMNDLTVLSWLELAEKIGRPKYSRKQIESEDVIDTLLGAFTQDDIKETDLELLADMIDDEMDSIVDRVMEQGEELMHSNINGEAMGAWKKKHKKKRKGTSMKNNEVWHTFVRRVFVSSKSDEELEEDFG